MTPKEHNKQVVEEFDIFSDKLWDKYGESYEVYNPKAFTNDIKSFLLQKLRERDDINKTHE